ncbi:MULTISPECIES: rhamnulokinase [Microbacterium]|uniref:rhamnulokinase n=2 Tax=Microbacteriaceae TaxID=85023 RepID=UPI003D6A44A0|nr:FGGY-family carbohydrate kinase [Microbacteriaceae bacterium K1510]
MSAGAPVAFLAVDLGSSSGRVMLGLLDLAASDRGGPAWTIREAGRFANVPVRSADGWGWDIPTLWGGVVSGLRAGVIAARRAGAAVEGIGVDSWGVDYARLTTDGTLRPFVRHHRDADAALAARTAASRDGSADYAVTGVLDQAINTVHQLRQDAAAGIGTADDRILLIADTVVHLLTGAVGAETSLASSTALVDRATDDWSAALGADLPAAFPPLTTAGTPAGATLPEVSALIGAADPVPVWWVTAHDTAAAFSAVVDAVSAPTTAVVSAGSWAVTGLAVAAPLLVDAARVAGFTQEIGAHGETLLVKNISGMWLLQQTMREWAELDAKDGRHPVDLHELLRDAAASTYGGTFDPADPTLQAPDDLVGRLESACAASGALLPATRSDLVRAILESLALAYARTLDQLEDLTGSAVTDVRIVGGGSRNDLLCALTAQRTGLPVIAGPAEASVRGLLFQLAVAAGRLPDLAAARHLVADDGEPPFRRYTPRTDAPRPIPLPTGTPV